MKSLAFFNNKGGVGKTTLACNMASHLAKDHNLQVLVVDLDPQCNATQLLLTDEQWEHMYGDRKKSPEKTILKVLKHIRAGDSNIDTDPKLTKSRRFGVDVLPGHPTLSTVEDKLSSSWVEFKAGDLGGARRSLWASSLVTAVSHDLIIFDVGPSLGAINRSALLGSDRFITPMAADLFSLYALDNIAEWIATWIRDYARAIEALGSGDMDRTGYGIMDKARVETAFAGYTIQQYVTKNMGGSLRTVNAYDQYKQQIPERAMALSAWQSSTAGDLDLGVVPNMFSMVPLAQAAHAPIRELTTQDGLRGAQVSQQRRYVEKLESIAERLAQNIGLEG